ncbi:MAG: hypothetical protein KBG67_01250 [Candidatus Atribacteria bacterium]|nr:hypothetical protein [Candidatus Atribacteria bacterium]
MRYFKVLVPIIVLILALIVEGGCFQKPIFSPSKSTIKGKIVNQIIHKLEKKMSEQAVTDAVINVIDPKTGFTLARSTTDQNGFYSLHVPSGGPYVVQAEKEKLRLTKVIPVIKAGETKIIQLTDARNTALALIFQELKKRGQFTEDFDENCYLNNQYFSDLESSVNAALLNSKDPAKNQMVQNYTLLVLSQSGLDPQNNLGQTASLYPAYRADKKSGFSTLKLQLNDQAAAFAMDFSENESSTQTIITLTVPYGTDVSNLVATFTTSEGSTVTVGSVIQESGVTPNDFSRPVEYMVTAQDGVSKKTYTISVVVAPNTECEIKEMKFSSFDSEVIGVIADNNITLTVPYGTDVSNLVASFAFSEEATVTVGNVVQVSGITPNDFSQPVEYLVTAQDGINKKTFTVSVDIAPNTECKLITFGFVDPPVKVKVTDEEESSSRP